MGKGQSFQQMMLRKLNIYITPYIKIKSKCIKGLNLRAKTIELWGENIGKKLYDNAFWNSFLGMTPEAQATREKNR